MKYFFQRIDLHFIPVMLLVPLNFVPLLLPITSKTILLFYAWCSLLWIYDVLLTWWFSVCYKWCRLRGRMIWSIFRLSISVLISRNLIFFKAEMLCLYMLKYMQTLLRGSDVFFFFIYLIVCMHSFSMIFLILIGFMEAFSMLPFI